ncbi:MAG: hypothetical protein LBD75_05725 [Candidatus Peribacteria bacterium]|jgi:tripartite-type tricarboxylate transporter receptor subunit TctC|nr:hypothetical protein [Candidatus Peribacteria bacterium]
MQLVVDNVGGGSGNVGNNGSKLSNETIEESRFSDIGCSNKSNMHRKGKQSVKKS